ncbi:MAG: 50S ribosomal protein L1 [Aigarchaeota archaeon]|nr:50S ribosomal protein L1 [Aigarchaeota archaeon]MDW7985602.1 50S ribosomal protein L1 [Nitrososphaerota archaeon]
MLKTLEANLSMAIERAKNSGESRKFEQSLELIINIKGVDLKKTENRFVEDIELPNGLGDGRKICIIAGSALASEARRISEVSRVIERDELESLVGNKRLAKKIASQYDYFLIDPPLMGLTAKALGAALGGRGKRPVPIPPGSSIGELVKRYSRTVTVSVRKNPQAMCMIGSERMDTKALVENALTVISKVSDRLEKHFKNIKSIYVKKTMGKPVKVEL